MSEAIERRGKTGNPANGRMAVIGVLWAALVAISIIGVSRAGYMPEGPDEWTYDWRTLLFSKHAEAPRSDIAIVLVDEESLAEYDYLSPVDRGMMAKLIRAIDDARPKAIGLDFIYDRKSEAAKTEALIEAIRTSRSPVIFGAIDERAGFGAENLEYQERFIAATGRPEAAGHVILQHEGRKLKLGDEAVRFIARPSPQPPHRPSFAELLARLDRAPSPLQSPYIAWLLPPESVDLFPLFRVRRHQPSAGPDEVFPPAWRRALKDKIVLIGGDFPDRDRHLTPLSIGDGAKIPGVFIQAQILAQRLDGRSINGIPWPAELALAAIVAFLGFLFSVQWRAQHYDWLVYIGGLVLLGGLGVILFAVLAIIIPSTTLFFAWTGGVTGGHYAKLLLRTMHRPSRQEIVS